MRDTRFQCKYVVYLVLLFVVLYFTFSKKETAQVRLIFCIHPGRSGAGYLAKLLQSTEVVRAFHEVEPRMNGEYLDMILQKPLNETFAMRADVKIRGIEKQLKAMKDEGLSYYAETSSMFIKTYHDVVMEYYTKQSNVKIYVIILRRFIPETVVSMHEMQWLRGQTELYRRRDLGYYSLDEFDYDNEKLNNGIQLFGSEKAKQFVGPDALRIDYLIAYNLDIESKAQHFIQKWRGTPNVVILEEYLSDLATKEGANNLLWKLGLPTEKTIDKFSYAPVNTQPQTVFKHSITVVRTAIRMLRFVETYKKYNVYLPKSNLRTWPNISDYEEEIETRHQEALQAFPGKMTFEEKEEYRKTGKLPERLTTEIQNNNEK